MPRQQKPLKGARVCAVGAGLGEGAVVGSLPGATLWHSVQSLKQQGLS